MKVEVQKRKRNVCSRESQGQLQNNLSLHILLRLIIDILTVQVQEKNRDGEAAVRLLSIE